VPFGVPRPFATLYAVLSDFVYLHRRLPVCELPTRKSLWLAVCETGNSQVLPCQPILTSWRGIESGMAFWSLDT
jgi:hypothetical protein